MAKEKTTIELHLVQTENKNGNFNAIVFGEGANKKIINKNYSDLNDEQKAIFDSFVGMVSEINS